MTRALLIATLVVSASATLSADQKTHAKHQKKSGSLTASSDAPRATVDIHFSIGEQRVIREYYAPRQRALPPGLQKKVARGGQLPPGWRKKLQAFPPDVERRLEPLPRDCGRGVIDGHAVIFNTRTHVVLDVTVLF